MKRFAVPCLALLGSLLAGCGGSTNGSHAIRINVVYSVTPEKAEVATGGSVDLTASVLEGGYSDLNVTVREGATGGAAVKTSSATATEPGYPIPDEATYTAPANPGIYHVDVQFLNGTKVLATTTATIAVVVPP